MRESTLKPGFALAAGMLLLCANIGCQTGRAPGLAEGWSTGPGIASPAMRSDTLSMLEADAASRGTSPRTGRNDHRAGRAEWVDRLGFSWSATVLYDVQRAHHGRVHNYLRFRRESVQESYFPGR